MSEFHPVSCFIDTHPFFPFLLGLFFQNRLDHVICSTSSLGNPLQCCCLENPRDGGAWWLPSIGSHRVGHDWSDLAAAAGAVLLLAFPGGSDGKQSACNVGHLGSIPVLGRSPGMGMATHFGILAWRIPWTEDPGGLQSTGSQRVRPSWATKHSRAQCCYLKS